MAVRSATADAFMAAMVAALGQAAQAQRVKLHAGAVRRDWAVVLYSGECAEHPGRLCAMQAFGPCTLAETSAVVDALPAGFTPHRVSLLDPAEYLGGGPVSPGPRAASGDPTGDPPGVAG